MVFVAMKSISSKIAIIVSPGAPRPLPQGPGPACGAYFSKPRQHLSSSLYLMNTIRFTTRYFYNAFF